MDDDSKPVDVPASSNSVVKLIDKRSVSEVKWDSVVNLMHLVKVKGKFWNKCGISIGGVSYLYPEETIWLLEMKQLVVVDDSHNEQSHEQVYQRVLSTITVPVYLTYMKLRSLDYIVLRHSRAARTFSSDAEVLDQLERNPQLSLLDTLVTYDLYMDAQTFTKRAVTNRDILPLAYVVICDGENMLSARVLLTCLEEAAGIPLILAAVSSTGFVTLEEFTDATKTLVLTNDKTLSKKNSSATFSQNH